MPKAFDDILDGIKKSSAGKTNLRTKKPYSESDLYAIATAAYKKKFGRNPTRGKPDSNEALATDFVFEYLAPFQLIEADATAEGSLKPIHIKGTAVDETISYNNVKYTAELLRKAAPSMVDKPILKDHKNEIDSLVGRTTKAWYDEASKRVEFEGDVMDAMAKEMILDGRIKNVSIGARANKLVREKPNDINSPIIPEGLSFLELSLVPIQGVKNATISQAICEKMDGVTTMVEEDKENEDPTPGQADNASTPTQAPAAASTQESAPSSPTNGSKTTPKIETLAPEALQAILKEFQALKDEVKTLRVKPTGKGVISTENASTAPKDEMIRERTKDGVSFYSMDEELIYGRKKVI